MNTYLGYSTKLVIQWTTATNDKSVCCYNKFNSFVKKKSKGGEGQEKKSENSHDLNPLPANPIWHSIQLIIQCATATHDERVYC